MTRQEIIKHLMQNGWQRCGASLTKTTTWKANPDDQNIVRQSFRISFFEDCSVVSAGSLNITCALNSNIHRTHDGFLQIGSHQA